MATMSITSQNTICIRARKRNIRFENIVNPSGNGESMPIHQNNGQKACTDNKNFVKKRKIKKISNLID